MISPRCLRSIVSVVIAGCASIATAQPAITTGPNLGTHSTGPLQLAVTVEGGTPPYTWAVTGGALPGGMALRADVPPFFPPNSVALSGVTTAAGSHGFTLTVTDSATPTPNTALQPFTLETTSFRVADVPQLPQAFVGDAYDFAFTTAGAAGPVTFSEDPFNPPPAGFTVTAAGHVTGTPSSAGFFGFNVIASDGSSTINRWVNVAIFAVHITTPGMLPNATQGAPYSTMLSASGGTPPYSWSGGLPGGFMLDPDTGVLSSPSAPFGQQFFHITATDSTFQQHTKTFMVVAVGTPTLPELQPVTLAFDDYTIGEPRSMWFSVIGGVPPYTWSINGLPPASCAPPHPCLPAELAFSLRTGEAMTGSGWPNQAELSGTALALGSYQFTVSVTDSAATPITTSRVFTLKVSELTFDHPDFSGATLNAPLAAAVRAYGGTGSSHTGTLLTPDLTAPPTGVTFGGGTLTFSGTPLEWGGYGMRLQIADGHGHTLNRSTHMHVNGGAPDLISINMSPRLPDATRDQPYFPLMLFACCAPSIDWTVEPGSTLPPGLVLSSGQIGGTPTVNGDYTFRLRATDAGQPGDFVIREFHLKVTPVVITSNFNLNFGNNGTFYAATLTATGGATGFTWTLDQDSALPPGLTLSANGELTGTPTTAGLFRFTVIVTDQAGSSRKGTLSLEIYAPGGTPPLSFGMGTDFGSWMLGQNEFGLHANGGDGTYVWQHVSGTLPHGIRLRTDPAPWFGPNTFAGLIGVATTPGPYEFVLSVTSAGQTIQQTFNVVISPLLVLDPGQLPDAFVGQTPEYSYTFSTNSAGAPVWEVQQGTTLPAGLTLDPSGTLHGTPTTAGIYNVHFRIIDGTDIAHRGYSLTVSDIQIEAAPSAGHDEVEPGVLVVVGENPSVNITFTASSALPSPNYVWSAPFLPGGLAMSPGGVLTGTVNRFISSLRVTVTDTVSQRFTTRQFTINRVGVPPVLPSLGGFDVNDWTLGVPRTFQFGSNGGRAPFTWVLSNAPAGLAIRSAKTSPFALPGQGELFGVLDTAGTHSFDVSVTDSSTPPVTVTQRYTVRVSELILTAGAPPLTFGVATTPTGLRVIGGATGYAFVKESGKLPAGITLSPSGVLSGTPLETGGAFAQLLITDDAARELRTSLGFFVAGPSTTLQINSHWEFSATEDQPFSNTLFACCLPSYAWAEEGGSLPPWLSISPAGVLSGTPPDSGDFTFRVRVFDPTFPANFAVKEFVLKVAPFVYTAPTSLAFMNVGADQFRSLALPTIGGIPVSGPVTWTLAPGSFLPIGLSLVEVSPGDWRLTGTPESPGLFVFTLILSHGGYSRMITFSLNIYPAGATPPLNLQVGGIGPTRVGRVVVTLTAFDGQPPYTYALSPGATPIPGMRVQDDNDPQPSQIPAGSASFIGVITTPGSYTTTVRVTDNAGAHIDRPVTITVLPITVTSPNPIPSAVVGQPFTHQLTAVGGSGSYLWTSMSPVFPAGLTLSPSGLLSGTPTTAASPGFGVTVSDGSSSTLHFVNITIHPFAITNNAVLPIATQGSAYSVTLSAPGCPCTWTRPSGFLPQGLSLSSAGVLSGTPTGFGTSTFTVEASVSGQLSRKVFTVHVRPNTPQPIVLPAPTLPPTTIGQQYTASFVLRGGVAPYTWSHTGGALPPGLTLADGGALSSQNASDVLHLAGVPTEVGPYDFTIEFTDSNLQTASATFAILVSPLMIEYRNLPLSNTVLQYGTPYQQRLLGLGGSGVYTWGPAGQIVPGLSLAASDLVSGTPVDTGFFNPPVQITDTIEGDTLTQSVSFNIASNTPFGLNFNVGPNLGVFQQGFSATLGLSASGGPPPPADPRVFTFTLAPGSDLPPGFALLTGNTFGGGPGGPGATQLAFTALAAGTFTFRLEVRDQDGNFAARTMTITILPFTIFTGSALPDATQGLPYSQVLHAWGGGTWSVAPDSLLPPGLTLGSDTVTGTPTLAGNYSFTLRVCDASLVCVSRNFTLRVSPIALTDAAVFPTATLLASFSHSFGATGGGASKQFSVTGQLPPGLSLGADGTLIGAPTASGTFTFTINVTDGVSTFSKRFTIFVADANPPLLGPTPSSGIDTRYVTVGQSLSFQLNARNGRPPYTWALTGGSLPFGMALYSGASLPTSSNPGTTTVAGAPTTPGTYVAQVTATDADGTQTTLQETIIVSPVAFIQNSLRGGTYNTLYAQQLVAGGGVPPYTFALVEESTLPAGLSLSAAGLIDGTPIDTGNTNFQVEITDAGGSKMRRSYGVNVASGPSGALDLFNGLINDLSAGQGFSFTLRANGAANTNIVWTVKAGSSLPPGLQLLSGVTLPPGSPAGSAVLAGVPTTPGTHDFALQAADSGGTGNFGERRFTIRVTAVQIVSSTLLRDATVGQPYVGDALVVAGGTPPYTYDVAPFVNNAPPPGLAFANGVLSGLPSVGGNFVFTIRVFDAGGFRLQRNLAINIAAAGEVTPLTFAGRVLADQPVGAALAFPLDFRAAGGVKPYTWTVVSPLPPGLKLVPGDGTHSAHLAGNATTPGSYEFSLTLGDSAGQSITGVFSMKVSALRLAPELLPPAVVDELYPQTLTATGGTPPYVIEAGLGAGIPPGLTRSIGANTVTLSGTPTAQGRFGMGFTVTDQTGATFSRGFSVNVDAAATPTPYLSLSPMTLSITHVQGDPATPVPVAIASSSATLAFTAMMADVPAASLSVTSGSTPRTTNVVFNEPALNALTPGVYYGVIAAASSQSIIGAFSIPVTLTIVPAPPCVYTLGSSSASAGSGTGSGAFTLTTGGTCAWTAESNATWLQVTTAAGTGSDTIGYTITESNPSSNSREGVITVGGEEFTVTQFGTACSFVGIPSAIFAPSTISLGASSLNASAGDCAWTATSSAPSWLVITEGASGPGSKPIKFDILTTDLGGTSRTATIDVLGDGGATTTITVHQAGLGCAVTLSESSIELSAGGDASSRSGSVEVTSALCGYTTIVPPQMEQISGETSPGPGTVYFTISPNVSTSPRTVTMYIGGAPYQIYQPGMACNPTVTGSGNMFNASGGTGGRTVGTDVPTCDWSASSAASWLIIDSGHTGVGPGAVTFSVAPNTAPTQRSTVLTVAGEEVQITQDGITCSYALRSEEGNVPATGGSGSAGVIAASACGWTATSNAPWLAITSTDNAGTGYVSFVASANPGAGERVGTLTIATKTYEVTQPGAPCAFTLSSSAATIASIGGGGSFTFSTSTTGCAAPTINSYSGWIEETHDPGTSGAVQFTVHPNPFAIGRTGRILVGDEIFTVNQLAGSCAYSLHAPSATFSAAGGFGDLLASPSALGCTPAVGASPEITLNLLGPPVNNIFTQHYTVDPFASSVVWVRVLNINFGGVIFAVKQTSW